MLDCYSCTGSWPVALMLPSTRLSWGGSSWAEPTGLPFPSPVWYVWMFVILCTTIKFFCSWDMFIVRTSCNIAFYLRNRRSSTMPWFACFGGCTNLFMGVHLKLTSWSLCNHHQSCSSFLAQNVCFGGDYTLHNTRVVGQSPGNIGEKLSWGNIVSFVVKRLYVIDLERILNAIIWFEFGSVDFLLDGSLNIFCRELAFNEGIMAWFLCHSIPGPMTLHNNPMIPV